MHGRTHQRVKKWCSSCALFEQLAEKTIRKISSVKTWKVMPLDDDPPQIMKKWLEAQTNVYGRHAHADECLRTSLPTVSRRRSRALKHEFLELDSPSLL